MFNGFSRRCGMEVGCGGRLCIHIIAARPMIPANATGYRCADSEPCLPVSLITDLQARTIPSFTTSARNQLLILEAPSLCLASYLHLSAGQPMLVGACFRQLPNLLSSLGLDLEGSLSDHNLCIMPPTHFPVLIWRQH